MHPAGIIVALIVAAAACFLRSEWERRQLSVERYEIRTGKLRKGARLVFLSDLHSVSFGEKNSVLLGEIDALSPQAILIGGDMITCGKTTPHPPKTDVSLHLMEELCSRYPVFYAEGNHELRMKNRFPDAYKMYTDHLEQLGVEYLRDSEDTFDTEQLLEDEEDNVNIYGVSMSQKYFDALRPGFGNKKEMDPSYLPGKLGEAETSQFNLLMMHTPLYLHEAAEWGADLVLSGHFHGGTIRLPHFGGLMTPQYQFLIRECAGEFAEGSCKMIVSRGLGTHSVRIRLNDLPEISCIDIVPDISE